MRIFFDLKVLFVRIIFREIIGEEGKDECAKMFVIVGKWEIVLIFISRKLVN